MLQRIQTVYLLIIVGLMVALLFLPLAVLQVGDQLYTFDVMERPDVDKITGLSPVISIEQKTTNKNPRSTVGTTTEVYDYLRLLYARAGEAYSYLSGEKMVKYTEDQILQLILEKYKGKKTYLLAPLVRNRKGHYKELFEQIRKKGYINVRVDGEMKEIFHGRIGIYRRIQFECH